MDLVLIKALLEQLENIIADFDEREIDSTDWEDLNRQELVQLFNSLSLAKRKLEADESSWISCKIRFPEVVKEQYDGSYISDPVWVTYKSIFDETSHTATEAAVYLGDEKWKWFNETDDLSNMEDVVCEIIAWRPLLEPYIPADVIQACVNKECPHN